MKLTSFDLFVVGPLLVSGWALLFAAVGWLFRRWHQAARHVATRRAGALP